MLEPCRDVEEGRGKYSDCARARPQGDQDWHTFVNHSAVRAREVGI